MPNKGSKRASKPFYLQRERSLSVDVDDTLLLFAWPDEAKDEIIEIDFNQVPIRVWPHKYHIRLIKEFKMWGFGIIVWSQGGAAWSNYVVERLGLSKYVDIVCGKPDWLLDDKTLQNGMGKQFYLDPLTGEDTGVLTRKFKFVPQLDLVSKKPK